jgi:hypothetical protein
MNKFLYMTASVIGILLALWAPAEGVPAGSSAPVKPFKQDRGRILYQALYYTDDKLVSKGSVNLVWDDFGRKYRLGYEIISARPGSKPAVKVNHWILEDGRNQYVCCEERGGKTYVKKSAEGQSVPFLNLAFLDTIRKGKPIGSEVVLGKSSVIYARNQGKSSSKVWAWLGAPLRMESYDTGSKEYERLELTAVQFEENPQFTPQTFAVSPAYVIESAVKNKRNQSRSPSS